MAYAVPTGSDSLHKATYPKGPLQHLAVYVRGRLPCLPSLRLPIRERMPRTCPRYRQQRGELIGLPDLEERRGGRGTLDELEVYFSCTERKRERPSYRGTKSPAASDLGQKEDREWPQKRIPYVLFPRYLSFPLVMYIDRTGRQINLPTLQFIRDSSDALRMCIWILRSKK